MLLVFGEADKTYYFLQTKLINLSYNYFKYFDFHFQIITLLVSKNILLNMKYNVSVSYNSIINMFDFIQLTSVF